MRLSFDFAQDDVKNGVPGGAPFAFYEYGFLRLGRRIT
jgi:hypothetical protein